MHWQTISLFLSSALLAAPLVAMDNAIANPTAIAQSPPPNVQVARARTSRGPITFNPPRRGAPPATIGLGSRGDCLENRQDTLRVLAPNADIAALPGSSSLGLTTEAYPSLFVYVPAYQTSAQGLSLRLMQVASGDREVELYHQTFALPSTAGIVQLQPAPSQIPALQIGQQYHWYVSMVCSSVDQSGNPVIEGWTERISPDQTLSAQLHGATPLDKAMLYGQAGIWQDTLTTLAELRRAYPNDPTLRDNWRELLQSVGLGAIANAPLLDCCQPLD